MADKKELATTDTGAEIQLYKPLTGLDLEEMSGVEINYPKVKIPSGGGLAFEIPGEEDDIVKEIEGVIVYSKRSMAYYKEAFAGGNEPPDCYSMDGITGFYKAENDERKPFECAACPKCKFGSAGRGKACKTRRSLFILRQGKQIPIRLNLPVTSLANYDAFVIGQAEKGLNIYDVVCRVKLSREQNKDGIPFSKALFSKVRNLEETEKSFIHSIRTNVKEALENRGAQSEYEGDEDLPF